MNTLDRIIAYFSPKRAYERVSWREGMRSHGSYKGARRGNNNASWWPVNGKAEQVNTPERSTLRARARDLERNSDVLSSILLAFEHNVVGSGFKLHMRTDDDALNEEIEKLFREWSKPRNCDITERQSFDEICMMAVRRLRVDGGILFVKCWQADGKFPFSLQAREVDDLDESLVRLDGKSRIINGVEVDQNLKPLAYHLTVQDPEGWQMPITERLEAKRVIALWDVTRPSQVREISPQASVLERVNDIEDYIDTVGMKEKILASVTAFIKRALPIGPGGLGRGMGTENKNPDYDESTGYKRRKLGPGTILELQQGDDMGAVIPTGQAANAKDLITQYQRLAGASQGLSYEVTSRDMSQVNYSSARQGLIADNQTYQRVQRFMIDHFLNLVFEEFLDSIVLSGALNVPNYAQRRDEIVNACDWTASGQPWIDPLKEANANKTILDSGLGTLADICAKQGQDWRDVLTQRATELAYMKQLEVEYGISMEGGSTGIAQTSDTSGSASVDTTDAQSAGTDGNDQ